LTFARAHRPDLLITDVMMPRLDGFGLLRELRSDEETRHMPIMMVSARAGDESRLEGFQPGSDDYLVKPFTARELVARVEAQLLRARIRTVEERSTRRIASVFARAPVPIAIFRGPDHVVDVANESCVALVNRPVVGKRLIEAVPELTGQGIVDVLDRVYTTGEPYVGRPLPVTLARGANQSAERFFFDVVCQPLFDHAGSIEGVAAVAYDVTELAKARHAAEAANRTKDEFLAMLGHELRNPLAPILTALGLMRLRGVEAGERERKIIERQVRHLVRLIDDLLDISRITRGKIRLRLEPIELNEVVAKAIELASPLLEQHQHALETDVPRQGLGVTADPARLAQVIGNLLMNSAKYTPPGGHIRVAARAEQEEVVLSVRDTGIGIDAAMLPSIFDLFTQDHQAIDRAQGGLGLGLAIVRNFVRLHGGSVSAFSEGRGRGSEFVIRLPKLDAAKVPAKPKPAAGRRAEPIASGLRVLIVDDNEDAAVLLAEALSTGGHITATASDGPSALHAAVQFKPHVALLDIGLPVMDGFELARQLRALPEMNQTWLVAVTGYGQEHDRRASAAAGFDAHLVKPVDIEHLGRLVQKLATTPR
jgi:signal transduction histidine kinase